jgi:hypothetical protein
MDEQCNKWHLIRGMADCGNPCNSCGVEDCACPVCWQEMIDARDERINELTGHFESLDALFDGDFGLAEIAQAMITIEIALGIHEKRTEERRLLMEKINEKIKKPKASKS